MPGGGAGPSGWLDRSDLCIGGTVARDDKETVYIWPGRRERGIQASRTHGVTSIILTRQSRALDRQKARLT